jgi:leucyl aminopeptidase
VIYSARSVNPLRLRTSCLVVPVADTKQLDGLAAEIDSASGGSLARLRKQGDLSTNAGKTLLLYKLKGVNAERILLAGAGKPDKLDLGVYRKICNAVATGLNSVSVSKAALALPYLENEDISASACARHACEILGDRNYRYVNAPPSGGRRKKQATLEITLLASDRKKASQAHQGAKIAAAITAGKQTARDLANLPGNLCTPMILAREARKVARANGLEIDVLGEREMSRLGMGSLLSVSRGSRQPAKLIVLKYLGAASRSTKPVVLVGKGLTFDAGGISLKPSAKMDEMKYDMCGATSVIGSLIAAANLVLPINVIGVIPSSENLPDGDANKPGDVVTSMSGKTIEVLNTDAEGRLILCDALAYSRRFKPATVIDIATLTGACIVALGAHASGVMTNDQELADDLVASGQTSHDRVWQLPLWDDYQSQLNSNFADIANIGGPAAGTITAGCFLSRFTEGLRWAHLDIAGTAWRGGSGKGATGRVVPLLTQYLVDFSNK